MLPEEIKALRKRLDWSQQVLALALGVTQSTVAKYERGETEPSRAVLILLNHMDETLKKTARKGEASAANT